LGEAAGLSHKVSLFFRREVPLPPGRIPQEKGPPPPGSTSLSGGVGRNTKSPSIESSLLMKELITFPFFSWEVAPFNKGTPLSSFLFQDESSPFFCFSLSEAFFPPPEKGVRIPAESVHPSKRKTPSLPLVGRVQRTPLPFSGPLSPPQIRSPSFFLKRWDLSRSLLFLYGFPPPPFLLLLNYLPLSPMRKEEPPPVRGFSFSPGTGLTLFQEIKKFTCFRI